MRVTFRDVDTGTLKFVETSLMVCSDNEIKVWEVGTEDGQYHVAYRGEDAETEFQRFVSCGRMTQI